MIRPTLQEEKALFRRGYRSVAGFDEVGVGPLAGPVVAAGVMIRRGRRTRRGRSEESLRRFGRLCRVVRDSKLLSEKQREALYETLTSHPRLSWAVTVIPVRTIDTVNIYQATLRAMRLTIKKFPSPPHFVLFDGRVRLNRLSIPQKCIVKGDGKVFCLAAASIIAKVTRDRIMRRLHKKFPQYGFDRHKGYATKFHQKAIAQFGRSPHHRTSYHLKRERA